MKLSNLSDKARERVEHLPGNRILREFKEFAVRGNVVDLAIGIMLGTAFNKFVNSFVNDIIMPPIGLVLGKMDFSNLFFNLSGTSVRTVAEAKEAGAATVNYGLFFNSIIDFLIIAFVTFLIVKQINRWKRTGVEPPPPDTKDCPFCLTNIAKAATRCPHCTSQLQNA